MLLEVNTGESRLSMADGIASVLTQNLDSMRLLAHLEELRKRIILSVVGVVAGCFSCWSFADRIFSLMQLPTIQALRQKRPGGRGGVFQSNLLSQSLAGCRVGYWSFFC